ncbi:MAG: hypothetical protein COA78_26835 [Blastopirellula sp.]|nr:MAG: hypothetical protein COA78_26835 [Blastopirellula sp.]
MTNIFRTLAIVSLALLSLNVLLGLRIGDYNGQIDQLHKTAQQVKSETDPAKQTQIKSTFQTQQAEWSEIRGRAGVHMVLGTLAAICTVLASCVCLTYFVGTSRWCKEVTEAYHFETALAERSANMKRLAFQLAVATMTTMMLLVAIGSLVSSTGDYFRAWSPVMVTPHMIFGFAATALVAFIFLKQMQLVTENYQIIRQLSEQVQKVRQDKDPASPAPKSNSPAAD